MEEASLFSAILCQNQTEGDDCKHFLSVWVQLSDGESRFSPEVEFWKSRQRLPDGEQMTGGNDPKKPSAPFVLIYAGEIARPT